MVDEIKKRLRTKSEVIWFETTESTQTEVRRRLADGADGRLLIGADAQTNGRGRRGRSFYSPERTGLYFTVSFPCDGEPVLFTCAAACVVCRALEHIAGIYAGIKWVNDIYYENKKIAGILTERIGRHIVVGVGINLTTADFPAELDNRAGSIGKTVDKAALCAEIANGLFDLPVTAKGMLDEYRRRSVLTDKRITFEQNGVVRDGTVLGFDNTGGMLVRTEKGQITLTSGEITVREL